MRSRFGDGSTPPKVLDTPKPVSSVMINRTFGAPLGGTTRGAHQGVDWAAFRSILPSNLSGSGGSCFPLMGAVAHGEPAGQFACCAAAGMIPIASKALASATSLRRRLMNDIGVNRMGVSFLALSRRLQSLGQASERRVGCAGAPLSDTTSFKFPLRLGAVDFLTA